MDWRHGSYVIGFFDWMNGGRLNFTMARATVYGALVRDPRQATDNPHSAFRWQSRQAARQMLRSLQKNHTFGQGWEVVNLKKLGTH